MNTLAMPPAAFGFRQSGTTGKVTVLSFMRTALSGSPGPSRSARPIFDRQARIAGEIGLIVGDQDSAQAHGVRGDQAIQGIAAVIRHRGAQSPVGESSALVERQERHPLEEQLQNPLVVLARIRQLFDPDPKLSVGNDRNADIPDPERTES